MKFNWWREGGTGRDDTSELVHVDDIIERVIAERDVERKRSGRRPTAAMTVALGYSHAVPTWSLSAPEAHRFMQQHRNCRVADCPRKAAAWSALVAAGKIRPDSGRPP